MNRRRTSTWAVLAACLIVLAGCGLHQPASTRSPRPVAGSAIPVGSSTGSIESGGRQRTYRTYPTSVIAIHGTADHNIPYDGGVGSGTAQVDGPAVPDVIANWRAFDRCSTPATTTAGVVTTSQAQCPGSRSVELVTIDGAGHQWPGGKPGSAAIAALLGLDQPSTALNATLVIWAFFAGHSKA